MTIKYAFTEKTEKYNGLLTVQPSRIQGGSLCIELLQNDLESKESAFAGLRLSIADAEELVKTLNHLIGRVIIE